MRQFESTENTAVRRNIGHYELNAWQEQHVTADLGPRDTKATIESSTVCDSRVLGQQIKESSTANREALEHFVLRRKGLNSKPNGKLSVWLSISSRGFKSRTRHARHLLITKFCPAGNIHFTILRLMISYTYHIWANLIKSWQNKLISIS